MQAALALHVLGFVVMSVKLQATENGGKRPFFMKGWQQAKHDDCIDTFFDNSHNALAILTGKESDVLVVDCDVLKPKDEEDGLLDGIQIMDRAFKLHNEKEERYLTAVTGNNGKHFYFSLSKSVAAGLKVTTNTSKLIVSQNHLSALGYKVDKASATTIDVRGDGGCCFCAPTEYSGKSYRWMSDPQATKDLAPCPLWLIEWLNSSADLRNGFKRKNPSGVAGPSEVRQRLDITPVSSSRPKDLVAVFDQVKPLLEAHLGNKISCWYERPDGGAFHVEDKSIPCAFCCHEHHSNSYHVYVIVPPCVEVRNYSPRCSSAVLGWKEVPSINNLIFNPHSDYAFVDLFVAYQKYKGYQWLWYEGQKTFLRYNGIIWKPEHNMDIGQLTTECGTRILNKIVVFLATVKAKTELTKNKDEEITKAYNGLLKASHYIQTSKAVEAVIKMAKYRLHDSTIVERMDADPNLLGCKNGVIDLRTGDLITDDPEVFVSKQCPPDFKGIHHPSPDVDAFMSSIFNDDQEVINYMQRLLGYGMTGLCREEVFVVFTGAGGNGKSLLNKLIKGVMGPYWNTMSRDCVFKSERHTNPGGPSPHLAMLRGLRISVLDDCNEQETLDDGTIKKMTSGVPIDARMLNQNPIVFTPTHLPIICTNHLPKINVDDEAIERRLVLFPFANNYRPADKYDPNDPSHRPIDMHLGEKLSTPEVLEQFLAWMVKGVVAWYKDGLGIKPALLSSAQSEYYEEHDLVGRFIATYCKVEATARITPTAFQQALESSMQVHLTGEKIKKSLIKKGFTYKKTNGVRCYLGLELSGTGGTSFA